MAENRACIAAWAAVEPCGRLLAIFLVRSVCDNEHDMHIANSLVYNAAWVTDIVIGRVSVHICDKHLSFARVFPACVEQCGIPTEITCTARSVPLLHHALQERLLFL
jgi:hypothetical protein